MDEQLQERFRQVLLDRPGKAVTLIARELGLDVYKAQMAAQAMGLGKQRRALAPAPDRWPSLEQFLRRAIPPLRSHRRLGRGAVRATAIMGVGRGLRARLHQRMQLGQVADLRQLVSYRPTGGAAWHARV